MSPSQIKTSEDICDAQQERAALAGGAKAGAANYVPSKVVDAVSTGSKGAPLMREYKGRIQLVDLAAYGAPAKSIGYHYPDLFFSPAAPSNKPDEERPAGRNS